MTSRKRQQVEAQAAITHAEAELRDAEAARTDALQILREVTAVQRKTTQEVGRHRKILRENNVRAAIVNTFKKERPA